MKNGELSRQLQSLQSLFKRIDDACGDDIELRSHWAKYLCILCAGFLENALKLVYTDFCNSAASEAVASYANRNLGKLQNPKTAKFIEIATYFKKTWGENLKVFVDDNGRREAIDSIMQNRHSIAHGKTSNITLVGIKEYFKKTIDVIDFIEEQCKP
jgi:hypothetical protein